MIRLNECPSWSIAPLGAALMVVLLTEGSSEPSESRSVKDRSKIERNAFDL